jgi:hypothetical protein
LEHLVWLVPALAQTVRQQTSGKPKDVIRGDASLGQESRSTEKPALATTRTPSPFPMARTT